MSFVELSVESEALRLYRHSKHKHCLYRLLLKNGISMTYLFVVLLLVSGLTLKFSLSYETGYCTENVYVRALTDF